MHLKGTTRSHAVWVLPRKSYVSSLFAKKLMVKWLLFEWKYLLLKNASQLEISYALRRAVPMTNPAWMSCFCICCFWRRIVFRQARLSLTLDYSQFANLLSRVWMLKLIFFSHDGFTWYLEFCCQWCHAQFIVSISPCFSTVSFALTFLNDLISVLLQNILEKFNPSARQMINAGKAYLKALHGKHPIYISFPPLHFLDYLWLFDRLVAMTINLHREHSYTRLDCETRLGLLIRTPRKLH